jgi:hypothetical protein
VGDLVWVGLVTHRRLNWLPGVIESAVSIVSYRVLCNNRVRQVSSSHLHQRSEGATCLEVDPAAVDGEPSTAEKCSPPPGLTRPPLLELLSTFRQPAPVPAPQLMLNEGAQTMQGGLPSLQGSEVPTSTAVQTPVSAVRVSSPRQEPSDTRRPVPVPSGVSTTPGCPLVSRRGRLIIPPKALQDYIHNIPSV